MLILYNRSTGHCLYDSRLLDNPPEGMEVIDEAAAHSLQDEFMKAHPPKVVTSVPPSLTRKQFFIALQRLHGITQGNILTKLSELYGVDSSEYIEGSLQVTDSLEFYRSHAMVEGLAPLFGLSPSDLDNLFTTGSTIQ